MNALIIVNDAPYGSERAYNALRLAGSLAKREDVELRVFLIGDAVSGAMSGQKVPSGYYNVGTMLRAVTTRGGCVGVCGSCLDARGIGDSALIEGNRRSSMEELTEWIVAADRVVTF